MATKTRDVIATLQRHALMMRHYQPEVVFSSLREPVTFLDEMVAAVAAINADPHLTTEGRAAKRSATVSKVAADIEKWRDARLGALDANLSAQRAALAPSTPAPDPRKVDHLLAVLRTLSPREVAVVYGSATDDERQLMEAANALVGRQPTKTPEGGTIWAPLLDPDIVAETVLARAETAQPEAASRMRELAGVREMTATVASVALAEVKAQI
ncbi:MAG: hypothetical protein AB7H93_12140 [Vicinamibacterales bacterium]